MGQAIPPRRSWTKKTSRHCRTKRSLVCSLRAQKVDPAPSSCRHEPARRDRLRLDLEPGSKKELKSALPLLNGLHLCPIRCAGASHSTVQWIGCGKIRLVFVTSFPGRWRSRFFFHDSAVAAQAAKNPQELCAWRRSSGERASHALDAVSRAGFQPAEASAYRFRICRRSVARKSVRQSSSRFLAGPDSLRFYRSLPPRIRRLPMKPSRVPLREDKQRQLDAGDRQPLNRHPLMRRPSPA